MLDNMRFIKPELPQSYFEMPDLPSFHMWSDSQFEIIKQQIKRFEQTLDIEHEVGIMLTNFGQSVLMEVTEITYEESVVLIFKGYVNGKMSTLIQHINQLNFLLTSVEKEPERPKRVIGFISPSNE